MFEGKRKLTKKWRREEQKKAWKTDEAKINRYRVEEEEEKKDFYLEKIIRFQFPNV